VERWNLQARIDGINSRTKALDRDYLTIPADDIIKIEPTLTMLGGRVVFEAPTTRHAS
jgi:hypothetical protein